MQVTVLEGKVVHKLRRLMLPELHFCVCVVTCCLVSKRGSTNK